ncbi:hypothetical protein GQ53DRAFT_763469 [Thozetella sp. PMI_491]|nr:hypothetical protein GQ53DRAFT_763469 [Thozetella sp. PMI_491]
MAGYFDSTDFVNPMPPSIRRATAGAEHGRFEPPNPHTCDACLTPFANGVQLLEHARAAGHLPFRCKCGMFLSRKDALERHVKSMAPVSSERCPQCSKSFKRWDHVEQHLKAYHKVPHQFLYITLAIGQKMPLISLFMTGYSCIYIYALSRY